MVQKSWLTIASLALVLSGCAQQDSTAPGLPWWGWLIIILVIFLLFWLVFRSRPVEETPPPASAAHEAEAPTRAAEVAVVEQPAAEAVSAALPPDDLTLIEGIGPKINSILQAAGVNTFAQLAALEPQQIMAILTAGGIRLADATTWPEQAGMAARGEMQRLHLFQETLKGGRKA